MTEQDIREYICVRFPQENESCEWKEYKNLQNSLCGHEADDVVSYVSAKILAANPNLELADIVLLDKVQKHIALNKMQVAYLRKSRFIEGRVPNIFLSGDVASGTKNTELKSQYVKNRSFDDDYFRKLILNYLKKFGTASRKDINILLTDKLSAVLSDEQKANKVDNLLRQLRKTNMIEVTKGKLWQLKKI